MSETAETARQLTAFTAVANELFDIIAETIDRCGDEFINATPPVAGINSVFALVTHIDGMVGYWAGSLIAGESIARDRDSEFTATGTAAQAHELLRRTRTRLPGWARVGLTEGIRNSAATGTSRTDAAAATPEWVLAHILRELAQHVGQMEICRDVVLAGRS